MSEPKEILLFILTAIGFIYGLIGAGYAIYFNYIYLFEKGFVAWLFFGEIIASLKALVWPLFEFNITSIVTLYDDTKMFNLTDTGQPFPC